MAATHPAMDIPQIQGTPPRQYYPQHTYPSYHTGSPPGGTTISPAGSVNLQQPYPQPAVNFNLAGGAPSFAQNSPSAESRLSGGSGIGYRPPSVQSGGYRLAKGPDDSEGYLEPRSSGSSFYSQMAGSLPNRQHDSGVDIDHPRENGHHEVCQSSGSDQSASGSVNFHPNGVIGWSPAERPAKEPPVLSKDNEKSAQSDGSACRHEYEELPTTKDKYAGYADVDDNTQSNLSSVSQMRRHDGSNRENGNGPAYRRRQNPLYDAILREDSKASSKSAGRGVNRCLSLSIVLLTFLSTVAVIVACIALSVVTTAKRGALYMVTTPGYTQLEEAYAKIAELESKYELLVHKYEALNAIIGINETFDLPVQQQLKQQGAVLDVLSNATLSNSDSVLQVQGQVRQLKNDTSQVSKNLQNQLNQIEVTVNTHNTTLDALQKNIAALEASDVGIVINKLANHSREISNLESAITNIESGFGSFRMEILAIAQNISKMPGPMGPPGVGNLSQCEHKVTSRGVGMGINRFVTPWIPTEEDYQHYVILGMECTTNTAFQQLEVQSVAGFDMYRCSCDGESVPMPSESRFCELHYWRCPKIS